MTDKSHYVSVMKKLQVLDIKHMGVSCVQDGFI